MKKKLPTKATFSFIGATELAELLNYLKIFFHLFDLFNTAINNFFNQSAEFTG